MDPSLQVAPLGLIAPIKEEFVFFLNQANSLPFSDPHYPVDSSTGGVAGLRRSRLSFAAFQKVNVEASITAEGTLTAKLKYVTRGENELVLRVAFHQTPMERWKEVAGFAGTVGWVFGGAITNVTASDPMATKEPFTVEYEITRGEVCGLVKEAGADTGAAAPDCAAGCAGGRRRGEKLSWGTPAGCADEFEVTAPGGNDRPDASGDVSGAGLCDFCVEVRRAFEYG